MSQNEIRVFLCHASADKPIFAQQLATDLRNQGVKVWFDDWSMKAGDSLRQKIFGQGIPTCTHFLVILSKRSIHRPWVEEELDAALVSRLDGGPDLVPIVFGRLDKRDIPLDIQSKVYRRFPTARGSRYDREFARLLDDLGKSSTVLNTLSGPSISIPLSGMRPFMSIQREDYEHHDWWITNTRVQLALSGLFITEHQIAFFQAAQDFSYSSSFDRAPAFNDSRERHGYSHSSNIKNCFHNVAPFPVSRISDDPRGVDPLTIAERSSSNYGRSNSSEKGAIVLSAIGKVLPDEPTRLALGVGSILFHQDGDQPEHISASGILGEDWRPNQSGFEPRNVLRDVSRSLMTAELFWQFRIQYQGTDDWIDYAITWTGPGSVLGFFRYNLYDPGLPVSDHWDHLGSYSIVVDQDGS